MKTLPATAVALVVLASPTYAQMGNQEQPKDLLQLKYEQEERARKEIDKEYDAAMKRTGAAAPAAKRDPWGNVRSVGGSSAKR
jgi:hypothetical protein